MRYALLPAAAALALAGCTAAQQAQFQSDVTAFNNDVALIDFEHRHDIDGAGQ